MAIRETTVRPMDGVVEHPGMDLLRVGECTPWPNIIPSIPIITLSIFPNIPSKLSADCGVKFHYTGGFDNCFNTLNVNK